MTGFPVPRTTYTLEFEEADYAGLEIRVSGATLDELFELDEAGERIAAAVGIDAVRQAVGARNALFVRKVIGWNLEEDKVPVPCTVEALGSFEAPFVNRLISTWRRAASGVSAPLVQRSSDGELSPVESTLTEIPSESLAS